MVNLLKIGIQQPSCRTTLESSQIQMSFPVWGFNIIILSFQPTYAAPAVGNTSIQTCGDE